MKSAYEIATEKLGDVKTYTDAQKAALNEISSKYEARRAELSLGGEERIKAAAGDILKIDAIRAELSLDLKKLQEKEEREKAEVRESNA